MLRDSLNREFGGTAVEEANRLLKGWMELPFSMVGRMGNTGNLAKRDRALDQSTQGRAPHPRSLCSFLLSCSIQNGFHRVQIAKKDFPLLLIEVRIIKGGELAEWLSVVFFWKTSDRGVRGLGTLKALQMGRQRIRENRGRIGGKADQRSEASQLNIRQINEQVPTSRRVSTPFPNRCFSFGWRPAFSQALDDFLVFSGVTWPLSQSNRPHPVQRQLCTPP